MSNIKTRELAVGVFILAVGLGYLYMTSCLPRKQFIDAAFFPYILAITMCLLGVFQVWEARRLSVDASARSEDKADYLTVAKTLGLITTYAVLLEPVGFPITTVVYLFVQFIVLTPTDKKINYPMYAVIAIMTSAIVYSTFRYAFDMLLPTGLLSGIIE